MNAMHDHKIYFIQVDPLFFFNMMGSKILNFNFLTEHISKLEILKVYEIKNQASMNYGLEKLDL